MEIKTVVTEILLRFSTGMEHQHKKPGDLEGAHRIEVEYFFDDDGKIIGETRNPKNHHAQPLDPEKVQPFLGEQFMVFEQQLAATKKQGEADVAAAGAAHAANVASLKEQLKLVYAHHADTRETIKAKLDEVANGDDAAAVEGLKEKLNSIVADHHKATLKTALAIAELSK